MCVLVSLTLVPSEKNCMAADTGDGALALVLPSVPAAALPGEARPVAAGLSSVVPAETAGAATAADAMVRESGASVRVCDERTACKWQAGAIAL